MAALLPILFGLVAIVIAWVVRNNRRERLSRTAAALGMELSEQGFFRSEEVLSGAHRGRTVRLRYWRQSSGKSSHPRTTVTISGLHPRFSVAREGLLSGVLGQTQGDVQLGDAALDAKAVLRGPEPLLRARLDATARASLLTLLKHRDVKADFGELTYCANRHPTSADEVRALLAPACDLADALGQGDATLEELLRPAEQDPEQGVRLRCLLAILVSGEPDLRARAAAVAQGARTAAERALGPLLSGDRARIAALRGEALHKVAALDPSTIADHLRRAGAEDALMSLLGAESAELKVPAIQALGAIGTVRAVEPLLPLTEGMLTSPALKQAARAAVQSIQGRLGDVSAGSLSVVDGGATAGALSVSGEAGALSEARRPAPVPERGA